MQCPLLNIAANQDPRKAFPTLECMQKCCKLWVPTQSGGNCSFPLAAQALARICAILLDYIKKER